MTPRRARRAQAGFTLTELMVVVTIIGVLVTMAVVYMRPRLRPIDVANRLGDLVHEANRRAIALGPVRADVVTALGTKARTQILASTAGSTVTFTLYRLQEDPSSPTGMWMPIESYTVDASVAPVRWVDKNGASSTAWDATFKPQCRPDGTCDATTVYFQSTVAGPDCNTVPGTVLDQCAKLLIMPLGGAISTSTSWN